MAMVDPATIQETLDTLRAIRGRLYTIPGSDVAAMGLDDQITYGDNLQKVGLAILRLETAKLKGVSDQFKAQEGALKTATSKLEQDAAALADAVKFIRVVSDGLTLITNIATLVT